MNSIRLGLALDGEWSLAQDPADVGIQEQWFAKPPPADAMPVTVPGVWDLWLPDYDGAGWYFRTFEVTTDWLDFYATLEFDAVDYFAQVWLNGAFLGSHEGGYTPFSLSTGSALRVGNNRLAVRVIDPHGPGGYGDFHPRQIPCSKEQGYFPFAGIWGSVRLLGRNPMHLTDVFLEPDPRRKRVSATVTASQPGEVRLTIAGTSCAATGAPGRLAIEFPEFEYWCPESPKLYVMQCELLRDGQIVDAMTVRFGMREFTVKEGRFFLNSQPIFLKGVLQQPDYPRTLAGPESEELARRELTLARDAGYNLVRMHIKTPPPLSLDIADELGLLVYEEPPIGWIENSRWMRERCEREVREMVLRDRNHPCVVMWGMLNESGNADYNVNGGAQVIKSDLARLARTLDPSRVIIDDSGGVNSTREPSRLIRPYREDFEAYDDLHIYQRAPVDREIELYYEHIGDPDALCFLSEFGFGGMEDLPDVLEQYGPDRERLKDARFVRKMLDAAMDGFEQRELDRVFGSKGDFVVFDLNPYALANHHDYARGLWEQRYSGLVIAGVLDEDDSVVRRVHNAGVPYMTSCRMDTFPECSSATIDIEEGAYLSTDYLIRRGHKRIGMLKPFKNTQPGNARRRGYARACEAHGIEFDEDLVRPITLESADVINAVFRLVSDPTVTALIDSSGGEDSASIREGVRRAGRILGKNIEVLPWTYSHKATVLNEACAHLWLPLREAMAEGFERLEKWFRNEAEGPVQVLYRTILRETPGEEEFREKQTVFQLIT